MFLQASPSAVPGNTTSIKQSIISPSLHAPSGLTSLQHLVKNGLQDARTTRIYGCNSIGNLIDTESWERERFEEGNMMLVWVLVLTALLASDVAETTDSLEPEVTQLHLEKRGLVNGPCAENWFYYPALSSCYRFFPQELTWLDAETFCNLQQSYGHLATVALSDQNTFINNVIGTVSKAHAWIGLNDSRKMMDLGMICPVMQKLVLFVPTNCAMIRRLQNDPLILSSSGSNALISL
ncbi:uncharacterized protein LOC129707851 [Leucoraja erinacea]|uniref:uncharacterized protein LOC129707851 n=1 Tax=Leucoraja erinaceus TaxID=7782 RepID=UPI0024547D0D|nr:uncharacterized protein LOC129707851 [Leucoraja erinacea]